jgi:hypothetical protein
MIYWTIDQIEPPLPSLNAGLQISNEQLIASVQVTTTTKKHSDSSVPSESVSTGLLKLGWVQIQSLGQFEAISADNKGLTR